MGKDLLRRADFFFFQAEDGIRDLVRSRGLGDVYKRQLYNGYAVADARGLCPSGWHVATDNDWIMLEIANGMLGTESTMTGFRGLAQNVGGKLKSTQLWSCLLYTSDAADERSSVDLGGRRIIKKK